MAHVLYLLNTYPRPSHSFIRREIRALERQGHQVRRIAMRRSPDPLAEAEDRVEQDLTHYVLDQGTPRLTATLLGRAVRSPRATAAALALAMRAGRVSDRGRARHLVYLAEAAYVAELCRRAPVDHIHAHFGTNAATVAMLVRAMGGPPYSFTVHGPEEFDSPAALKLGEKVRRSAFTVAISSFGRSQICRWAPAHSWDRIKVVHCGIEPDRFPDPAPMPEGGPHLVAIGRFAEQKGHLALIQAMAHVSDLPDVHLTLVGDGEMRPDVEAAIRAAGVGPRVTLAGWQDEDGVRRSLAAAHALVLPSFAEGLPVVAMEAMAAGRPVIGTWIAGLPELVRDGLEGWLTPAGDPQALAAAIRALAATSAEDLRRMGLAARDRVGARHDVDIEAAKLAAHIRASMATVRLPRATPIAAAQPAE